MAGPWEAFQSANSAGMAQADQSVTAPPRAPVQSTPRVWGDAEAQSAGIYEAPAGPWNAFKKTEAPRVMSASDRAPLRITVNPVADRFGEMQQPDSGIGALQSGLNQRGMELTRGPQLSPAAQMAGEMSNLVPAASQGTTPHVDNYAGNLISTEAFEDDAGNVLYRDPETKEVKPTNKSTQIAIRDPADGVVKVFARSDATNESPVVGVSRVLAPGLAAGAVTARPAIAAAPKMLTPTASETFATAKAPYREFTREASQIDIPAETATGIAERFRRALDQKNLTPELVDPVYKSIERFEKGRIVDGAREPQTLAEMQNLKRVIGKYFNSPDKNARDAAAILSGEIGRVISETSRTAGRSLKTADEIHSTARAQQELARKGAVADLRTGRAGYGGNAVNNIRQVLSPIVQRSVEGKTTGFKPNEIAAMREIVEGTAATNALRGIGQLSPTKGSFATILGGAASAGVLPAIGAASNKLATILTNKQIERLSQLVAKRSPAYKEAVTKAVERFERAQIEFANDPKPARFAAYISASRALSSGLQRDGIAITSGDLIKSLTGPMKTAAEEDQAPVQGPGGQQ